MKKSRLKPCPFCARTPEFKVFNEGTGNELWTVFCKCGAESPKDSKSKAYVSRIWNRRRPEYIKANIDNNAPAHISKLSGTCCHTHVVGKGCRAG